MDKAGHDKDPAGINQERHRLSVNAYLNRPIYLKEERRENLAPTQTSKKN
jgi:hypothetical protein